METDIFILLGSNLGDRENHLSRAITLIGEHTVIVRSSSLYQTAPWGKTNQPYFLNQVISVSTNYTAQELLNTLLEIEITLGRTRKEKWGERTIDLDILFFNAQVIQNDDLIVPHPGIASRRFTLMPLSEIAPDFVHPILQLSCSQLLDLCSDSSHVERYAPKYS